MRNLKLLSIRKQEPIQKKNETSIYIKEKPTERERENQTRKQLVLLLLDTYLPLGSDRPFRVVRTTAVTKLRLILVPLRHSTTELCGVLHQEGFSTDCHQKLAVIA